jgi:preprotein translocase subunit SecE
MNVNEVSPLAYRYALAIYGIFAGYIWYLFYSLGLFLAKNYFPQSVSFLYSIQNAHFTMVHTGTASLLTLICVVILFLNKKLKEFVVDVGDELSRVSWPELTETQKKTLQVILLVICASIVLFGFDFVFLKLVNMILKTAL